MTAGIDIGAKGCMCIDGTYLYDYNSCGIQGYTTALLQHKVSRVWIEQVHAMPKQGVKSMFSFGMRLGEVVGMLEALGIAYTYVTPQVWQKYLGLSKADKSQIASVISSIYPNAQLYSKRGALIDGRSDALGIYHYGVSHDE